MALEKLIKAPARNDRRLGRSDRLQQHQDQAQTKPIEPGDFSGRYIYYGIREHGMAAAMNGMALHGGLIPTAARSWSSPTTAARRCAWPR
jgi:transketolase